MVSERCLRSEPHSSILRIHGDFRNGQNKQHVFICLVTIFAKALKDINGHSCLLNLPVKEGLRSLSPSVSFLLCQWTELNKKAMILLQLWKYQTDFYTVFMLNQRDIHFQFFSVISTEMYLLKLHKIYVLNWN